MVWIFHWRCLILPEKEGFTGNIYEVDLTGALNMITVTYGAVLSAGTFTHGHLGPGPLRNLLDIARPGGDLHHRHQSSSL